MLLLNQNPNLNILKRYFEGRCRALPFIDKRKINK